MALQPGQTSGTFNFSLSNAEIIFEAFDRIGMPPETITRHHLISARRSLNLELQQWANRGFSLWKEMAGTIQLTANQATYTLPSSLVILTEVYFSTVITPGPAGSSPPTTAGGYGNQTVSTALTGPGGTPLLTDTFGNALTGPLTAPQLGLNSDRIMAPLTRTQYAMIPNKNQTGIPTQFWYQRTTDPLITFWEVPQQGAPNYVVNWFGLQQFQDAGIGGGQMPDVAYRGLDTLCACMVPRLAQKFKPERFADSKLSAKEAWDEFVQNDIEIGPMLLQPNVGAYGRM